MGPTLHALHPSSYIYLTRKTDDKPEFFPSYDGKTERKQHTRNLQHNAADDDDDDEAGGMKSNEPKHKKMGNESVALTNLSFCLVGYSLPIALR